MFVHVTPPSLSFHNIIYNLTSQRYFRVLDKDEREDFLMMNAIFYHPVEKDETGGNMKGSGINCWKNYAIKTSFI